MNFLWTLLGAIALLLLASFGFLIGFLITGKVRIKKGTCGPSCKCETKKECEKEENER